MGLKEKIEKMAKKAVVIGSVAAATTFVPKAEANQSTDVDISQLKDVPEFVVGGISEQAEAVQSEQIETRTFLEQIKKGEKIEYNGISFDIPKLNASKDKDLKSFGFVFEDGQVGIKIHDDGKKFWGKDDPEKTYKVLMPEQDFENIMNILMNKDMGNASSDRPEDPHDWVYRDNFPHFYTVDKDGTQRNMTDAEAGKFYEKMIDTFCAMNSEGILDASVILNKYKKQIEQADYGWILVKAMDASTGIQNIAISKAAKGYKGSFTDMAVNTDAKRALAEKDFEFNKSVAIRRYERDKQEQAEIEQIRAEWAAKGLTSSSAETTVAAASVAPDHPAKGQSSAASDASGGKKTSAATGKKSSATTTIIAAGKTTYR